MLAYSARQFDAISGFQTSERTLAHSSRALKLVSKRIREPSFECEDGLVMAVAVLAFAEVCMHIAVLSVLTLYSSGDLERMSLLNGTGSPFGRY